MPTECRAVYIWYVWAEVRTGSWVCHLGNLLAAWDRGRWMDGLIQGLRFAGENKPPAGGVESAGKRRLNELCFRLISPS